VNDVGFEFHGANFNQGWPLALNYIRMGNARG
jgi:hypothetical protein